MKIIQKFPERNTCPYCAQIVDGQRRLIAPSFTGPHGCVYAVKAYPNLVRAAHINLPCRCLVGIQPPRAKWVRPLVRRVRK